MKTLNEMDLNIVAGGCIDFPPDGTETGPFGPTGGMPGPTDPIGPDPEPLDDLIWSPTSGLQI